MEEKSTFSVSNLTEEEKAEREKGIDSLLKEFKEVHPEFAREYAEELFDKMQQKAIEMGKSVWKYYQQN